MCRISPKEPAPAGGRSGLLAPTTFTVRIVAPTSAPTTKPANGQRHALFILASSVVQNDNVAGKESRVCDAFVSKCASRALEPSD